MINKSEIKGRLIYLPDLMPAFAETMLQDADEQPAVVAPPDRQTALDALSQIQDAITESTRNGYDMKTLARWVLGIVDETRVELGGDRMTPDEFDQTMGGNNGH